MYKTKIFSFYSILFYCCLAYSNLALSADTLVFSSGEKAGNVKVMLVMGSFLRASMGSIKSGVVCEKQANSHYVVGIKYNITPTFRLYYDSEGKFIKCHRLEKGCGVDRKLTKALNAACEKLRKNPDIAKKAKVESMRKLKAKGYI